MVNGRIMRNIDDILAHYEEQPPAECWDRLSCHLDKIMPTGESSAASSASAAAKGATATLSKVVTASIIGAVAAAAITIAAVTLTHKSSSDAPTAENQTNVATDSITEVLEEDTTFYIAETVKANVPPIESATQEITPSANIATPTTEKPSTENSNVFVNQAPTISTPQVSVQPKAAAMTPRTISPVQPSATKTSLPKNSTIAQQQQNDPVVQSHSNDEDFNWNPPTKIEIPNVFTPNGDGYNELFVIKGLESCSKRQLIIRNRSGKIVYRSNNYENNWNGDNCPDGSYTYQFFYNSNGMDQSLGGTVMIIRK